MVNSAIYERLKQAARERAVVYYGEIATMLGLNMDHDRDRGILGQVLGEISAHEHGLGHPLLSVVAVGRDQGMPSKAFFDAARGLGRYDGHSETEQMDFFVMELRAAHDYWAETDEA